MSFVKPLPLLLTAIVLAAFIAGCSSTDGDGDAPADAPAAATDSGGGGEATGPYKLTQAFDMSIEVTSPVFNRIRRIPKTHSCPPPATKAGRTYEQNYDPENVRELFATAGVGRRPRRHREHRAGDGQRSDN